MPRTISGEHEPGRHRQIGYRGRLAKAGKQEIAAVDTALAQALSLFIDASTRLGTEADQKAATHLERIAVDTLLRKVAANRRKMQLPPFDPELLAEEVRQRVVNRIYYLHMIRMHPDASARDKRRFALGPVPYGQDPLDWDEEPDPYVPETADEYWSDDGLEDHDDAA
ncbi:hypothetical protein U8C31_18235 [Sinorhizobium medicae]|uniref:hypothetical protein n=1 Tax=Sinorhizobium medicae TaxID=110321 RepID=UPI002AF6A27A|nr:hypothetical protein [Sinorhizobium medicae]WQO72176.1 hypothetical protein U8C31_18235 [Sinorhizobium medicae]